METTPLPHEEDVHDRWKTGPSNRCLSLWLLLLTFLSLASLIVSATAFQILWEIGHHSVTKEVEDTKRAFVPIQAMASVRSKEQGILRFITLPVEPDGHTTRVYRVEAQEFSPRSNQTVLYLTLGHRFRFSEYSAILEDSEGNELVKLRFFEGKPVTVEEAEKERFSEEDVLQVPADSETTERELRGYDGSDSSSDPDVIIVVGGGNPYAYPMTLSAYGLHAIPWGGHYGTPFRGMQSDNNVVCTATKCFVSPEVADETPED